ncbi:MAG TPA: AAA family ATPase [Bryobacteraceae bacterium]|jgi:type II secretory pathway predicted ATPase ExeA|nr:AAA family ATPase [Bryobacteraceae bacterium]
MYKAFFGLNSTPFNLSPDPSFLYRSAQHEEALASLIYGVQSRKGFIVLTGEVGTGKTTMLECLRDHLTAHRTPFAFLFNSRLTGDQFFEMIAYDFDLQCARNSKTEVLFALNNMLIQRANQNQTTVLIVDEAQNLEWEVLEEIRLLGNLETRRGKMLQIILSGQPELDSKLEQSEYRQLKQRIALRCHLRPFTAAETAQYIASRLARSGMREQTVFPVDVLVEIQRRTQGIPRLINSVCDNLLLTSFAMESKVANVEMLDEVSRDLHLEWPGGNRIWSGVGTSALQEPRL